MKDVTETTSAVTGSGVPAHNCVRSIAEKMHASYAQEPYTPLYSISRSTYFDAEYVAIGYVCVWVKDKANIISSGY